MSGLSHSVYVQRDAHVPAAIWSHIGAWQTDEEFVISLLARGDPDDIRYQIKDYMIKNRGHAPFDMQDPYAELPSIGTRFRETFPWMEEWIEDLSCELAPVVYVHHRVTQKRMTNILESLARNKRLVHLYFEHHAVLNRDLVKQLADALSQMRLLRSLSIREARADNYHLLLASRLRELILNHVMWVYGVGHRVAEALRENTILVDLTINNCAMSDADAHRIWDVLRDQHNTTLMVLDFTDNPNLQPGTEEAIFEFMDARRGEEE